MATSNRLRAKQAMNNVPNIEQDRTFAHGHGKCSHAAPRLLVVGVGGAGGNAVDNMIRSGLQGVDFAVANTDGQALRHGLAEKRLLLGRTTTGGLGAGADIAMGARAAEEALPEIDALLSDYDMVFITAGMGGGTGTGAAPVIARSAHEQGILTMAVVTTPFSFEGSKRAGSANVGITALEPVTDSLLVISNQNLFRVADQKMSFVAAFAKVDDVLHSVVRSVSDLIVRPGLVNLDFADVLTVMRDSGKAMMGTGEAEGPERAALAAKAAIANPLFNKSSIEGAQALLINITGGGNMTLFDVEEAVKVAQDEVGGDCLSIFGALLDDTLADTMRVSVVATGLDRKKAVAEEAAPAPLPEPSPSAVQTPAPPTEPIAPLSGPTSNPLPASAPEPAPVRKAPPPPPPGPWRHSPAVTVSTFLGRGMDLLKGASKRPGESLEGKRGEKPLSISAPVLVGLDFGSARTAVMTNRNQEALFRTVVGYPKDVIGAQLMGTPHVVGEKAHEMRSFVELRCPLHEGVLREYVERDVETAQHFLDHVMKSIPRQPGEEICLMAGVPSRASAASRVLLKKILGKHADQVQVASSLFLVAYGLGMLVKTLIIDIGAATIDLCALRGARSGQNIQITVKKAGNYIDERLLAAILAEYNGAQATLELAREIKENHSFVGSQDGLVIAEMRAHGRPASYNVTEAVRSSCEAIVPLIVDGIGQILQKLPPEDQVIMLRNIVLTGGGSRIRGIDRFIAERLKTFGQVSVSCVDEPEYAVARGALRLAEELPVSEWDKLGDMVGS